MYHVGMQNILPLVGGFGVILFGHLFYIFGTFEALNVNALTNYFNVRTKILRKKKTEHLPNQF